MVAIDINVLRETISAIPRLFLLYCSAKITPMTAVGNAVAKISVTLDSTVRKFILSTTRKVSIGMMNIETNVTIMLYLLIKVLNLLEPS